MQLQVPMAVLGCSAEPWCRNLTKRGDQRQQDWIESTAWGPISGQQKSVSSCHWDNRKVCGHAIGTTERCVVMPSGQQKGVSSCHRDNRKVCRHAIRTTKMCVVMPSGQQKGVSSCHRDNRILCRHAIGDVISQLNTRRIPCSFV